MGSHYSAEPSDAQLDISHFSLKGYQKQIYCRLVVSLRTPTSQPGFTTLLGFASSPPTYENFYSEWILTYVGITR